MIWIYGPSTSFLLFEHFLTALGMFLDLCDLEGGISLPDQALCKFSCVLYMTLNPNLPEPTQPCTRKWVQMGLGFRVFRIIFMRLKPLVSKRAWNMFSLKMLGWDLFEEKCSQSMIP